MVTDANTEVRRLRAVLRDLVALSGIPGAWVGREPLTVAEGVADTLMGLVQLKFVAVRLRDPDAGDTVEAMRGDARTFAAQLRAHLSQSGPPSRTELIAHVGGSTASGRCVVIPVGVNADGGVVAAVSDRTDFPSEVDLLLLHLAANQAATAFQNACLIHERERAEEELRRIQRLRVTEQERRRIAREIHDDALQSLGAVALRLSLLAEHLTSEEHRRSVALLLDLTRQSAERLRTLVFDLRADALDRGLVYALRSYVEGPTSLPVPCRIDSRFRTEPPVPVSVVLYRVAQEALTNVRKHAQASSARVLLDETRGGIRLRVVDDGGGFDLSTGAEAPGHLGLAPMRERAELAGGRLSVKTAPGHGTTVEVWVPLPGGR